jgi:acetyltransferase-like isoleucine patch superfamily enzyme
MYQFKIAVRRTISYIVRLDLTIQSLKRRLIAIYGNTNVTIHRNCRIGSNAKISCTDNGNLDIGSDTVISDSVQLISRGGSILLGKEVFLGTGTILVATESIKIGNGSKIAEYCVIRDQDHSLDSPPIKSSGFVTSPIFIGENCWLGAKVTVLRGVTIGNCSVIGANSLVRGDIPPNSLAVGCPARVVKSLPQPCVRN